MAKSRQCAQSSKRPCRSRGSARKQISVPPAPGAQSGQIGLFLDQNLKIWFFTTLMVLGFSCYIFFLVNLVFFCLFLKSGVFGYFCMPKIGDVVFKNAKFGNWFPRVRRNVTTLPRGRSLLLLLFKMTRTGERARELIIRYKKQCFQLTGPCVIMRWLLPVF